MASDHIRLGDQATLTKIDKLRELNIGTETPLPQILVVGDQSSGKSSLLENLTGLPFPRAFGLCTRYVTQITCCRDAQKSVLISIIPRPDADEVLKTRLLQFQRRITKISDEELVKIFEEANRAMGIRMSATEESVGRGAFSQDILKIEIAGPDQDHLTVIDVPGIFRVPNPGLTTESDIRLVENMVKSYMSNPRSIILTVIPCNADINTQEILKLAKTADPAGTRTMGVLTKPDLATEKASKDAIIDLVLNKRGILKLGYYVVKNRSADDEASTADDRLAAEKTLFAAAPWNSIASRCGIASLKLRIRGLLMQISKQEFPHVKSEVEGRLVGCRTELKTIGPSRTDQKSQRLYLGKLAQKFQATTEAALRGYYVADVFTSEPSLKIITRVTKLNEVFSDVFWKKAHRQHLDSKWDDEGERSLGLGIDQLSLSVPAADYPELSDIIMLTDYSCPRPSSGPILDHIEEVFDSNRGVDLATYSPIILATVFREQSEKWKPLVLSHTSKAILLIHDYIWQLLVGICPEKQVRDQVWEKLLMDKLRDAYSRAMKKAQSLLAIERNQIPITLNHYFNANLQKKRNERTVDSLKQIAVIMDDGEEYVPLNAIKQHAADKSNKQQVCEDILDALGSYYKVSGKRFVDNICKQVVFDRLLGDEGPLQILHPDLVMGLNKEQLEEIAGEDEESKHQRCTLERESKSLEAALKVLQS